jgi:6,7-dimethyl-8-ribityllumazine synthase
MGVRQGREDEGPLGAQKKPKLALIVSMFNEELTERMKKEALAAAGKAGARTVVIEVPGAFDMPLAVKKMLIDKSVDAVVTLGAVVKGETAHDEIVTTNAARAIADLSLEFRKPVTLGIIGHGASEEAADERAEEYARRAVDAALRMIEVLK